MRIRWGLVLLIILLVFVMAYNRQISQALRPLRLGEMWTEFCERVWAMPSMGRYTLVAMVLALLYLTAYFLIRELIRHK